MVVTNVMIHLDDAASNRKNKFIIFLFLFFVLF
jgi:nitrate reductase NapE component